MSIQLHFNRSTLSAQEQQWFNSPEAIQALTTKANWVTGGPYNRIWRWQSPEGSFYYIKIYHARGHHLRQYCAKSRARGEWENLLYFQKRNLLVPELLVYGESSLLHKNYEGGFLVQREVSNCWDLRFLAKEEPRWHADSLWRRQLLRNIAASLQRLHADRFVHRDFKWRNILIKRDDSLATYLIDCPLGRRHLSFLYNLGWWRDLRAFDKTARRFLSRTDRLRFYLAYRQQIKLKQKDKHMITKIYGENGIS
ncbi:MAG: hypothetical protein K2Q33_03795 [Gammaproteobacteria bacterium]|nr:hypothetical protein [Gammaproteobacteria bacterium]